jgi:hypothetical protein
MVRRDMSMMGRRNANFRFGKTPQRIGPTKAKPMLNDVQDANTDRLMQSSSVSRRRFIRGEGSNNFQTPVVYFILTPK